MVFAQPLGAVSDSPGSLYHQKKNSGLLILRGAGCKVEGYFDLFLTGCIKQVIRFCPGTENNYIYMYLYSVLSLNVLT